MAKVLLNRKFSDDLSFSLKKFIYPTDTHAYYIHVFMPIKHIQSKEKIIKYITRNKSY